jgi:AsmA family
MITQLLGVGKRYNSSKSQCRSSRPKYLRQVDSSNRGELVQPHINISRKSVVGRVAKLALMALVALVVLGLVAPLISVGSYRVQIQRLLEGALGRRVDFESIHYTLFSGPGFSIDKVTIGEDSKYGLEPSAYVPSLRIRVRLDKLLFGKVQVAGLRLVEPTLNLVKRDDGTWNVIEILDRLARHRSPGWRISPTVEISDGRLNFKFGNRKTIFYVDDTDIAVYRESSAKLRIRFAGSPSRTDRGGHGFGSFRGDVNWYLNPPEPNSTQLEADVTLERSNLSELVTLILGYDVGIHGEIGSHMTISGPAALLNVAGDVYLEDVHRWDLMPSSGEAWHVRYRGILDLVGQKMQFTTSPLDPTKPSPVVLQVKVNEFLTTPSWSVIANLHKAPAEKILPLARRMGLGLPEHLGATGEADGAVGYSNHSGWNGSVALTNVTAVLPDLPPFSSDSATVSITQDLIHFQPFVVKANAGADVELEGDYVPSTRAFAAKITAAEASIKSLSRTLSSWFGQPPMLTYFQDGYFSGQLLYRSEPPDAQEWSGQFQLSRAIFEPVGLARPVKQFSARVLLAGEHLDIPGFSATIGDRSISGDYHYDGHSRRKERVRLKLAEASVEDFQNWLEPVFGSPGFFGRFRFGRRSQPAWLLERFVDGDLRIGALSVGGNEIGSVETRFQWTGPELKTSSLIVDLPAGVIHGQGSVDFRGDRPHYRFAGELHGYPWKAGQLDATGSFETVGLGSDALLNLRASGEFQASDVDVTRDFNLNSLSGAFDVSFDEGWSRFVLSNVEAERESELWRGNGASQKDGSLVFELVNGSRQMRVVSTLDPSPGSTAASAGTTSSAQR